MRIGTDEPKNCLTMDGFYSLRAGDMLLFLKQQNASFWFILLYLTFEYLRPHVMYPVLNVLPWTQLILLCSLSALFLEGRLLKVKSPVNARLNLLFAVIILSSLNALVPQVAWSSMKTVIVLLLIYYLVINAVDDLKKYFIFFCLFLLIGFKFAQFIFLNWAARGFTYEKYGSVAGSGWLENTGEMAIHMSIVFALSAFFIRALWPTIESRLVRLLLLCIPLSAAGSVIASGSRGSFLALAVAFILIVFSFYRKAVGVVILCISILMVPYLLSERDLHRLQNMGSVQDSTAMNRLERWQKGWEMMQDRPVLGVGYNNWAEADRLYFDGTGAECHNVFIECGSELGFSGLLAFLLLLIAHIRTNLQTIALADKADDRFVGCLARGLNVSLATFLVAGMFVTVFYYPYFWVNLAMSVSLHHAAKRNLP